MHKLLEEMASELRGRQNQSARLAPIADLHGYMMGNRDAPLTIVEYADLQCPFCRRYATTVFGELKKKWIDTGKLRYVSRDFPLDFHPVALAAARAARCAGEQGKFWEMHTALMQDANLLSPDHISRTAGLIGVDMRAFALCTASTKYDDDIERDRQTGIRIGVGGTPTFVIAKSSGTMNGVIVAGAQSYAAFDARLTELLSQK